MSQYSEVIGSFLRRGDFPLEADYVFATEQALKDYYNQEENKAILHKGLLKVVEDDGNGEQALYWVSDSNGELTFTKLITGNGIEDITAQLDELREKLETEIQERKDADDAIWGTTDPTTVPEDLNSILDLCNAVKQLQEDLANSNEKINTIKEELKATVGTDSDDIVSYLNTLDYKSLTELSSRLNTFFNTTDSENSSITTWVELSNFLAGIKDSSTLQGLLDQNLNTIYGDPLPSEEFRTLRGIEDFVRVFKQNHKTQIANLKKEVDATQAGVGLDASGNFMPDADTNYLQSATSVMNALKILDAKVLEAIAYNTLYTTNPDVIDLEIIPERQKTRINGVLKLSAEEGNALKKNADGLYMRLETDYENGVLTIKVNGNLIGQHNIGSLFSINDAYYDTTTESIVIVFTTINGVSQTVRIPAHILIREWIVNNDGPSDVVILTRVEDLTAGSDKLSADVRLSTLKYNILVKDGNSLYVKGTSDNIVHNDVQIGILLDQLLGDSSQTSQDITEIKEDLTNHINNISNPHQVTAEQVNAYTKEEIDNKLALKADLVDGIVPDEQLPDLTWVEV